MPAERRSGTYDEATHQAAIAAHEKALAGFPKPAPSARRSEIRTLPEELDDLAERMETTARWVRMRKIYGLEERLTATAESARSWARALEEQVGPS